MNSSTLPLLECPRNSSFYDQQTPSSGLKKTITPLKTLLSQIPLSLRLFNSSTHLQTCPLCPSPPFQDLWSAKPPLPPPKKRCLPQAGPVMLLLLLPTSKYWRSSGHGPRPPFLLHLPKLSYAFINYHLRAVAAHIYFCSPDHSFNL